MKIGRGNKSWSNGSRNKNTWDMIEGEAGEEVKPVDGDETKRVG